jgi:2-C-methyl-D-erythritol 2,4-cyclodiphosphate synthase
MTFRIGQGIDVHAFGPGDHVVLGGVTIAHPQGLVAHSDGDVLLHAVCDALLGALGLGDIGNHFPDTDQQYKGADSRELLREVYKKVDALGYRIGNLDCTIVAEAPKMAPHLAAINRHLADDLKCDIGQINSKATTTEKLGFTGRKEGITALCVVLLESIA